MVWDSTLLYGPYHSDAVDRPKNGTNSRKFGMGYKKQGMGQYIVVRPIPQ